MQWRFSDLLRFLAPQSASVVVGGTAAAAPLPFRPGNPVLCESCPLVTPYYCRLGNLLCCVFIGHNLFWHFSCPVSVFQSLLAMRSLPCFHQTFHRANSSSSPNTSFFSPTSFHRHWLLSWRSKIFSSYNQHSRISWLSLGCLQYHSFISSWPTCSCYHKTV